MDILLGSAPKCYHGISAKFCTCHDSTAVMACAKICSDLIIFKRLTVKCQFLSNLNCARKIISEMGISSMLWLAASVNSEAVSGFRASGICGPWADWIWGFSLISIGISVVETERLSCWVLYNDFEYWKLSDRKSITMTVLVLLEVMKTIR